MSRRSINVPGLGHSHPIPNACRVGPLLMSGLIGGVDVATGVVPTDIVSQCRNMFANAQTVMEAAGGTMEDIVKVDVFLRDRAQRQAINDEWVRTFPDPASRPARHTQATELTEGVLVQCSITAFIRSEP